MRDVITKRQQPIFNRARNPVRTPNENFWVFQNGTRAIINPKCERSCVTNSRMARVLVYRYIHLCRTVIDMENEIEIRHTIIAVEVC